MQGDERSKIERIVKRIKSGEKNLIYDLYESISTPIRHIAYKYLHNYSEAEDLVQDFWADIYLILDSYHYLKNAYGYMCKIIRNRAIDRYRLLHKNETVYIDFVDYGSIRNNSVLTFEQLELQLVIDQAIRSLPKIQAIIIQSIYFEKCTIRAIAKELNMSKSEVFRQKQIAIMTLKKELE